MIEKSRTTFVSAIPSATVATITPDIARMLLESSVGNRAIRPTYVKQLAAAMRRGEWRVTSQGIGVDVEGHLRDAHHRLNAVVESGVSIKSVLVTGMPVDAYEVTDTGMKRTVADLTGMDRRVAEIVTGAMRVLGNMHPTTDEMAPLRCPPFFPTAEALIEFCAAKRRSFTSGAFRLAAVLTILDGGDIDYVYDQYSALARARYADMSPCAQALNRQMEGSKRPSGDVRLDTLVRGLRVFDVSRRDVTRVQVSRDDLVAGRDRARGIIRRCMAEATAGAPDGNLAAAVLL